MTDADAAFFRDLIERNPGASRRALSRLACQAWNWVQPNGALRDMVCRGLMLALHRSGHIVLPARRRVSPNPLKRRRRPVPVAVEAEPIRSALRDLLPLTFRQVRRTEEEPTFNGLIEAHHYLGYTQPVGEHLKYMVRSGERLLACLAWSSAPRHLGLRDRFIGWSQDQRRRNLRFLAYIPLPAATQWEIVSETAGALTPALTEMIRQAAQGEVIHNGLAEPGESSNLPGRPLVAGHQQRRGAKQPSLSQGPT